MRFVFASFSELTLTHITRTMEGKNEVTLMQFHYREYSLSPFCLKLETYLKVANIPYKNKFVTRGTTSKAKLPVVIINGDLVEDSSFIIERLNRELPDKNIDKDLTPQQQALTVAYQRLIEDSLNNTMVYLRWQFPGGWAISKPRLFSRLFWPLSWIVPWLVRRQVVNQLYGGGMGRHSPKEVLAIAEKNLFALSTQLGTSKFFFSNTDVHLLDIICFAEVTQLLMLKNPEIDALLAKYPNLVELQKAIKNAYWKKDE